MSNLREAATAVLKWALPLRDSRDGKTLSYSVKREAIDALRLALSEPDPRDAVVDAAVAVALDHKYDVLTGKRNGKCGCDLCDAIKAKEATDD